MHNEDIIRAWKDQDFYNSLTDEARAQLPAHPGMRELADDELEAASGGAPVTTVILSVIIVSIVVSELICDDETH